MEFVHKLRALEAASGISRAGGREKTAQGIARSCDWSKSLFDKVYLQVIGTQTWGCEMSAKEEYRNLSKAEAARLAGALWIHGSVDIEHSRERKYYYPRINLSMPNPLPYDYRDDIGGRVYRGKKYFTLQLKKQKLVEKRLKEILPFMTGEERKQIDIALQIIKTNRSRTPKKER
ncbi:MAG: hypothetical protein GTN76_13340, partial [Candidatus Aenigmarchaeota archaeon]|nr:hypothetical protein [Candidatus Aenigmarchaeota archaeon]